MARGSQPAVGGFQGSRHVQTTFKTDGRSLHPLQRSGMVPHTSIGVTPAGGPSGLGVAPNAAAMHLTNPPVLSVAITPVGSSGGGSK